jgi:hypothetical protein
MRRKRARRCRTAHRGLVGKIHAFGGALRETAEPIRVKSLSGMRGCARRVRHFLQRAVVRSDEDSRHIRYDAILDGPEGGS